MSIDTILILFAVILFLLAAIGVPSSRVNLVAAGLFCWALTLLIA